MGPHGTWRDSSGSQSQSVYSVQNRKTLITFHGPSVVGQGAGGLGAAGPAPEKNSKLIE